MHGLLIENNHGMISDIILYEINRFDL